MADDYDLSDYHGPEYEEHRKLHPDTPLAVFLQRRLAQPFERFGEFPRRSVAVNADPVVWREAGVATIKQFGRLYPPLTKQTRVLDYGCGTLRAGVWFIEHLDPGCYCGLDPVPELLETGKTLIGPETLREKRPIIEETSESGIAAAVAFAPDLICSNGVVFHIQPATTKEFFANLIRICHKPGSRLIFDAKLSSQRQMYLEYQWAWPQSFFEWMLSPLKLQRIIGQGPYPHGNGVSIARLDFARE